jgi:hypothetical protein
MPSSRMCPRKKILRFWSPSAIHFALRPDLSSRSTRATVDTANERTRAVALVELVTPSQPERSRDTCRLASPPRPELAGVCHSSRDGGGMEGIAAERPGWHSLRRNGLAAGHGEASGIGIHVTSPWPPKTPPSRPVNRRTTRQIDTNETRPRFPFPNSRMALGRVWNECPASSGRSEDGGNSLSFRVSLGHNWLYQ